MKPSDFLKLYTAVAAGFAGLIFVITVVLVLIAFVSDAPLWMGFTACLGVILITYSYKAIKALRVQTTQALENEYLANRFLTESGAYAMEPTVYNMEAEQYLWDKIPAAMQ